MGRNPYNPGPSIGAAFFSPNIKLYEPGSKIVVPNLDISAAIGINTVAQGAYIFINVLKAGPNTNTESCPKGVAVPTSTNPIVACQYIALDGTYARWDLNSIYAQYYVEIYISDNKPNFEKDYYISLAQALVGSFWLY